MVNSEGKQIVLVTGSSGCLGQHVVRLLHEHDDAVGEIRCFDLKPFQMNLQYKASKDMQITTGDIRKESQLLPALKDVDVVIHCAALMDLSNRPNVKELQSVNVDGTQTLIDAAVEANVQSLIFISGADVLIGSTPVYYGSENTTLVPKSHVLGAYSKSKLEAEQRVLEANGRKLSNGQKLRTVALRPTMFFGEEDSHFVPKALALARANGGQLRKIDNVFIRIQPTYVGNVAWACLKAKDKLSESDAVAGEAFFITDDTKILDPFEFLQPFLAAKGLRLSNWAYPYWAFMLVFLLLNWIASLIGFPKFHPSLTPGNVRLLCNTYFFNRTKATLRLEFEPLFEHDESINRSMSYYKKLNI